MTQVVIETLEKIHGPNEGLKPKFLNDVFLNGMKLAGILCRSESQGDLLKVMVGIGVNLNCEEEIIKESNKEGTTFFSATGKHTDMKQFQETLGLYLIRHVEKVFFTENKTEEDQ